MDADRKKLFDEFDEKFEEALQDLLYPGEGVADITAFEIGRYFGPSPLGIYIMDRLQSKDKNGELAEDMEAESGSQS